MELAEVQETEICEGEDISILNLSGTLASQPAVDWFAILLNLFFFSPLFCRIHSNGKSLNPYRHMVEGLNFQVEDIAAW